MKGGGTRTFWGGTDFRGCWLATFFFTPKALSLLFDPRDGGSRVVFLSNFHKTMGENNELIELNLRMIFGMP